MHFLTLATLATLALVPFGVLAASTPRPLSGLLKPSLPTGQVVDHGLLRKRQNCNNDQQQCGMSVNATTILPFTPTTHSSGAGCCGPESYCYALDNSGVRVFGCCPNGQTCNGKKTTAIFSF